MSKQTVPITFSQIAAMVKEKKNDDSFQEIVSYIRSGLKNKLPLPITDPKTDTAQQDQVSQYMYTNPEANLLFFRMKHPNPKDNSSSSMCCLYNLSNDIIPDENRFNQEVSNGNVIENIYNPQEEKELVDKQVLFIKMAHHNGFDVLLKKMNKKTYETCLKYISQQQGNTSLSAGLI